MRDVKLSASIMCADLLNLGSDLKTLAENGFDYLHFDVMDGHFVPEIGLGAFFLEQVTRSQQLPVDAHLMVTDPEPLIDPLIKAGASYLCIHCEIAAPVKQVLRRIRNGGARPGVALRLETPVSSLVPLLDEVDMVLLMAYASGIRNQKAGPEAEGRIRETSELLEAHGKGSIHVAVDGGVSVAQLLPYRSAVASFFILGTTGLFIRNTRLAEQADQVRRAVRL